MLEHVWESRTRRRITWGAAMLETIMAVLSKAPREVRISRQPAGVEGSAGHQQELRVLLAEDNEVNQRLSVRLLERRGHSVVVAANGREALAAYGRESFDLILMDVQMPEMNGLEATAVIREKEAARRIHTPIIAMTARAMGDREACLAAGMDAYVSKPVQIRELLAALATLLPRVEDDETSLAQGASGKDVEGAKEIWDRETLLANLDGDMELLCEVIHVFLEQFQEQLTEIREAVENGESERLGRSAHKLKGSVASLYASAANAAALELEQMGRTGELAGSREAVTVLEFELERLSSVLLDVIADRNHSAGFL